MDYAQDQGLGSVTASRKEHKLRRPQVDPTLVSGSHNTLDQGRSWGCHGDDRSPKKRAENLNSNAQNNEYFRIAWTS